MASINRGPLPTDNFTMLSNDWVRDKRLSWKARGLLVWLSSHAVGFQVSLDRITKASEKDGKEAVRTAIRELEAAGYLVREKIRDQRGRITSASYTLTDASAEESMVGFPDVGEADPIRRSSLQEDHSFMPASGDHPSGDQDLPLSRAQRERFADDLAEELDDDTDAIALMATWWEGGGETLVEAALERVQAKGAVHPDAYLRDVLANHRTVVGKAHHLIQLVGARDE